MILNTRPANGASSSVSSATSFPSSSTPRMAGMSSGDGRYSTTASRSCWTPLFLKAEPQTTGWSLPAHRRLAEGGAHLVRRRHVAVHELLHEGVVGLREELDEALAVLVVHGLVVGRDVDGLEFGAERVVLEVVGLALDEIDDALERLGRAPRNLHGRGLGAELRDHHLDAAVEVRADAVHLVDERDARNAVAVCLAPHRLGLRLDAGDGVEHGHRAVEHAQRALDLGREVHVARGVDDVDRGCPSRSTWSRPT